MGLSRCWPFRFNMIRCAQSQHIWTWSGENGEKGTRLLTFLASVKPRNLGARGLQKKKKCGKVPAFANPPWNFDNWKRRRHTEFGRNENTVIFLSLSLSLSLSVCALWPTTRHLHLWMRHLHLWTWPRIRMNIRLFRIDGVCVVNKGSFRVLKPVFKFLKVYYVVSLHWKEVRKVPGRRIALPVSLSNLCI